MTMEHIQNHKELNIYFKDMDVIDVKTIEGRANLRQFIAGMLSYYPRWVTALYRIRELVVCVLGLVKHEEPEVMPSLRPDGISFSPGENATFFIVEKAIEDTYWVAVTPDDRHLKAWFGIVVERMDEDRNRFHVFTTVSYIHWTGPIYFNLIRPFHHFLVWRMMKAGIKNL